jgi:CheY-like chemotaxis protein
MPAMDGFELIERVRARSDRLPIVVVSGDTDPATPERLRRLGVDAYFPKPYSPLQVKRKVEELLNAATS